MNTKLHWERVNRHTWDAKVSIGIQSGNNHTEFLNPVLYRIYRVGKMYDIFRYYSGDPEPSYTYTLEAAMTECVRHFNNFWTSLGARTPATKELGRCYRVENAGSWFVTRTTNKKEATKIGRREYGRGSVLDVAEATPDDINYFTKIKGKDALANIEYAND